MFFFLLLKDVLMGRPVVLTAEERKLREIGHKRFNKLLDTRVAHRMKPLLGKTKWANFVRAAVTLGKPLLCLYSSPTTCGVGA